jgi:hypothetical protein
MASAAEERRKKLQAVIKRKEAAKREAQKKERSNTSKEVNSKNSKPAKFKPGRGSEGLLTGGWGKNRGSGSNTNTKNSTKDKEAKAKGSQVKAPKGVTNPLSGTKFSKYAGKPSGTRKSIRSARPDHANNPLSIKKDLLNQTDDHEKETSKGKPKKESKSFGQAFKEARSKGLKVFTWKGKKYTTKQKGE